MATHSPSISVRQTTKSMYKPISKLNGDQLPMLRRIRRPELSGRITLYNHYTETLLNSTVARERMPQWTGVTNWEQTDNNHLMKFKRAVDSNEIRYYLSVSFKQHEHTMDTIRKEQAHIYKSLCKIKRLQRRVQRDEHEERRQEIRNFFKRQRRRQLMRRVVAKFRENVSKRRAERMLQQSATSSDENTDPVLSAQELLKYAGGFRRHTQPNVSREVTEVKAILEADNNRPKNANDIYENEAEDHRETIAKKDVSGKHRKQGSKAMGRQKNSQTGVRLDSIPELKISRGSTETKSVCQEKTKSGPPSSKKVLQPAQSTLSLPSNSSKLTNEQDCDDKDKKTYENSRKGNSRSDRSQPSIKSAMASVSNQGFKNGYISLPVYRPSSNDLAIEQIARENTLEIEKSDCPTGNDDRPQKSTGDFGVYGNASHRVLPSINQGRVDEGSGDTPSQIGSDGENVPSEMKSPKTHAVKGERRRNMVKMMERERVERARARARILDEEPLIRYTRKSQSNVAALIGRPKRTEFIPPSGKLRHEQDKLIRKEQDREIQSHINVERFFQNVFHSKEPVVYKQPVVEEAPKKPTLSLAGILGQLYTSTESRTGDKNSMENLKSCQYLRVNNPFQKKKTDQHCETSWGVAQERMKAGFMTI